MVASLSDRSRWRASPASPRLVYSRAVDRHRELVATGVGEPFQRGSELTDPLLGSSGPFLGCREGAAEAVLVVVVRVFEACGPGERPNPRCRRRCRRSAPETPQIFYLVAGAGFEPATFGL